MFITWTKGDLLSIRFVGLASELLRAIDTLDEDEAYDDGQGREFDILDEELDDNIDEEDEW